MSRIYYFGILPIVFCFMLASCSSDSPDSESVFRDEGTDVSAFDSWLYSNFTLPFNIRLIYRYEDAETDLSYNVVPAEYDKAVGLAILVKENWINAYVEAVDSQFLKMNCPRIYQLIGSNEYNGQNSKVLGTAEGGLKITLFGVNDIDLGHPYLNVDNIARNPYQKPLDLNYWFFHTIHHEFCHILTQKAAYDVAFNEISAGTYHAADWVNVDYAQAWSEGFVSGYASGEYNEDFAEIFSTYVTSSPEAWDAMMQAASKQNSNSGNVNGAELIGQKLDIVRSYFINTWNIDIDALRDIVLSHSELVTDENFNLPARVEKVKSGK